MAEYDKMRLTVPTQHGSGQHPSVCLHSRDEVAVSVCMKNGDLYYRVGRVDKERMSIEWSPADIRYTTGDFPSVALVKIDGQLIAVEVHTKFNICYYRVGEVAVDKLTIDWGLKSTKICQGLKPKVSVRDDGIVIVTNEEAFTIKNCIQYHIGSVQWRNKLILWDRGEQHCINFLQISGVQPNVSINEQDIVTIVYRDGLTTLKYIVGVLNEYREIVWGTASVFGTGTYPAVSSNSRGNVVAFHQTKTLRKLLYREGVVNSKDCSIKWSQDDCLPFTSGRYPSVSLGNDGYLITTYETSLGYEMFYSQGQLHTTEHHSAGDVADLEISFIDQNKGYTTGTAEDPSTDQESRSCDDATTNTEESLKESNRKPSSADTKELIAESNKAIEDHKISSPVPLKPEKEQTNKSNPPTKGEPTDDSDPPMEKQYPVKSNPPPREKDHSNNSDPPREKDHIDDSDSPIEKEHTDKCTEGEQADKCNPSWEIPEPPHTTSGSNEDSAHLDIESFEAVDEDGTVIQRYDSCGAK